VIYTVVCTDASDYIHWQCELLEYSWLRARQPGELLRLVAGPEEEAPLPGHEAARVVRMGDPGGRAGGYLAFERLFMLQEWLEAEQPRGSVLLIDPDCVFRKPIEREAEPGAPIAQHWVDYDAKPPTQAATWPALIHTSDLERLLREWIAFTRAIYRTTHRWESDMFGFVSAGSSINLRFKLDAVGAFVGWPDEQVGEAPLVHYCQDVLASDGRKLWSKRDYKPWATVEGGEQARHSYCADLIAILNEFAALKSAQ
jgi:hypothetical protein